MGSLSCICSGMYFNNTQQLAIKVIPESYDSDPDIFISKVSKDAYN